MNAYFGYTAHCALRHQLLPPRASRLPIAAAITELLPPHVRHCYIQSLVWHVSLYAQQLERGQSCVNTFCGDVTCARFIRTHVCVQFVCTRRLGPTLVCLENLML